MALNYIIINREETGPVVNSSGVEIAPSFSHYEFWGGKDSRNKTGDVHELSVIIIQGFQAIADWAKSINPNVGVVVTSTFRTHLFQSLFVKNGISNSAHTKKIAGDGKFVALNGGNSEAIRKEFIARFNTEIRDKGSLYHKLRQIGVNGFGLYGPGTNNGQFDFFHIDARNKALNIHGPFTDVSKVHEEVDNTYVEYAIWTRGDVRYSDKSVTSDQEGGDNSGKDLNEEEGIYEYVIKGDDPYSFYELVQEESFIGYGADSEILLNYKYRGLSNRERLYNGLPLSQQRQFYPEGYSPEIDVLLGRGLIVYIPREDVGIGKPASSGDNRVVSNKVTSYEYGGSFLDEERSTLGEFFPYIFKRLTLDPGYVPTYRSRGLTSKDVYPQLTVFAWSRTLYSQGQSGWIDLTLDIISCNYHDDKNGANFSIELSPVNGVLSVQLEEEEEQQVWEKVGEITPGTSQTVLTRKNSYRREAGKSDVAVEHLMNDLYYEKVLSQNDLIFISFEQLQLDDQRGGDLTPTISGKWYDVLGLVDNVSESINANGIATINVQGTDFTKVLINDRAYFSPFSVGHSSSGFGGTIGKNGRYLEGEFREFAVYQARTIQEQIEFITHRIASVGYVPDEVFADFLNKTEITTHKKVGEEVIETKKARGVWQLFKLFIDSKVADMRLADMSLSNPQGSILELMQSICQEPFVEFLTQTIGDKFYLIARRVPFDEEAYREIVTSVIPTYDFSTTGDGALSGENSNGNAYRKYLEELEKNRVSKEDSTDPNTQFERNKQIHVNVLKSYDDPNEVERFLSLSKSEQETILNVYSIGEVSVETTLFPLIINIGSEDVQSTALQMNDQSFSWYQIENAGDFLGKSQGLGYIPAVYFDKYAQIFGNERLKITSNYTNFQHLQYEETDNDSEKIAQHTARLLSFLIETHIYLPFTRKGSISLTVGDRRIKKGNFIYYRPTREVFYVDAVDHQLRVHSKGTERTTVIQVSRGMVIDFIEPEKVYVDDEEVEVSYFNIVNLPKIKEDLEAIALRGSQQERIDYKADFSVNEKVLKFFLSKRQFRRL